MVRTATGQPALSHRMQPCEERYRQRNTQAVLLIERIPYTLPTAKPATYTINRERARACKLCDMHLRVHMRGGEVSHCVCV